MVHCEDAVELGVGTAAEEAVGGVGTEGEDAALGSLSDGGGDDFGFLIADDTCVACVGVEGEDGDAGTVDAEVLDERAVEGNDLIGDGLGCDFACYGREGFVDGDEGHAQVFATHYHHGVTAFAETLFEILGVARKLNSSLWMVCLLMGAVTSTSMRPSRRSETARSSAARAAFPAVSVGWPGSILQSSPTTLMMLI